MIYQEVWDTKGMLATKAIVQSLDTTPKIDKKTKQRKRITEEVFDIEDSVADNAKMISLLISVIGKLYAVLPVDSINALSITDKAVIDHTFATFATTTTSADTQLGIEGTNMIDRILSRQAAISDIITNT